MTTITIVHEWGKIEFTLAEKSPTVICGINEFISHAEAFADAICKPAKPDELARQEPPDKGAS